MGGNRQGTSSPGSLSWRAGASLKEGPSQKRRKHSGGPQPSGRSAGGSQSQRVAAASPRSLTFEEALQRLRFVHHLHVPPARRALQPRPRYSPARGRGIAGAARATVPARLRLRSRPVRSRARPPRGPGPAPARPTRPARRAQRPLPASAAPSPVAGTTLPTPSGGAQRWAVPGLRGLRPSRRGTVPGRGARGRPRLAGRGAFPDPSGAGQSQVCGARGRLGSGERGHPRFAGLWAFPGRDGGEGPPGFCGVGTGRVCPRCPRLRLAQDKMSRFRIQTSETAPIPLISHPPSSATITTCI